MDKAVVIVIVTYNGMHWIAECLQSCASYPTVVVDNKSTDGTVGFIESNFPEVHLIQEQKNSGFGQANNKGISWALQQGFSNVFLLNQDAYLGESCIDTLHNISKHNIEYGILSPVHLNGRGDTLDKRFAMHMDFTKNPAFYSDFVIGKRKKKIYNVPFVNAAGWWITKKCLHTVGGFDPLFFQYGEDDNYCQRVLYHGLRIGVVPDVYIRHDREERLLLHPKNKDASVLETVERRLKKRFGNILEQNEKELIALRDRRKKESLRSLLKLNFRTYTQQLNEVRLINSLIPKIRESRLLNVQTLGHYLES